MKKSILLLAYLIGMVSCTDHKDAYDPNAESEQKKEEYDKNFPVTDIDPGQDWNSFTMAKVSVTVNEDWGETYVVKVYTANPLDENSGALLLAKGEIKSGETYSADIEISKALTSVWIARVDSHKRRLVKPAAVVAGKVESVFGTPDTRSVVESRSSADGEPLPYSEAELKQFMQGGTNLSTTTVTNIAAEKGTYYVPKGTTIYWNWAADGNSATSGFKTGDVKLIIAGMVISNNAQKIGNGVQVIVAQGGSLISYGNMEFNNAAGMVVMPAGTVTAMGQTITFANGTDGATNYIAGTANVGTWNNNGGTTYSCGDVNLTYLQGSSAGSTFINNGTLKVTGNVGGGHPMQKIINNCCFAISGTGCSLKDLEMGASSYLKCNVLLKGEDGTWNLDKNSIVEAGQLSLNNTDVVGTTGDGYALLRIDEVTYINYTATGNWGTNLVITKGSIINNIYLEYNRLTGKGTDLLYVINEEATNDPNQKVGNGNVTVATYNQSPLNIPSGSCTEGNTPVDKGDDEEDTPNSALYAFEDLGAIGDYDFNDVVLRVSHLAGSKEAKVELLAAGGTLKVAIKYAEQTLWNEVHEAFGTSVGTMINTGRGAGTKTPEAKTITIPTDATFESLKFSIVVTNSTDESKRSEVVSRATKGEAPQCLCVPGNWKWPKEGISIVDAYSTKDHAFGDWAADSSQASDWYDYPVDGKIY